MDDYVRSDAPPGPRVRRLDIDDARVIGGTHVDFPVLVSIAAPWLKTRESGGDVARPDGFDIHFSLDQGGAMQLAHEVERYAGDTGTLIAWVKMPALAPSSVFYIHYGDPALTTDPLNVAAVWCGGFQAVFHLDAIADASGKNTQVSSATSGAAAGVIDIACSFDGNNDNVDIGAGAAIANLFSGGGTAEAWFYAETFGEGAYGRIFEKGHVQGWSLFVNNTERASSTGFLHGTSSGGWGWWNTASSSITLNAWHHVAVTYNQDSSANDAVMYIDGAPAQVVLLQTPGGTMVSDASRALRMGNSSDGDRTFDGVLDELRLSSVVRSAGWIATEVGNQTEPAAFFSISDEL
jgi:MSHA biogenesis protein MshQ